MMFTFTVINFIRLIPQYRLTTIKTITSLKIFTTPTHKEVKTGKAISV